MGITVKLQQAWPPFDSYFALLLTITEDRQDTEFPLTLGQGRVLGRALRLLVRQYERLTAPAAGAPAADQDGEPS